MTSTRTIFEIAAKLKRAALANTSRLSAGRAGRLLTLVVVAGMAAPLFAQGPWEGMVNNLTAAVTGPIARGLSLVAIVVGGLTWAFEENHSKRALGGILFGIGMAVGATNFYVWLFGN
jgi:type IV secretory pathway VirB2 component (pilin)